MQDFIDTIQTDKGVIKSILFTKAIPNYVIPVPTTGYKVYSCIDCSDRFILESSYNHHVNRQSIKISYMCRYCGELKIFKNRCNFLSHIRSHAFKTATISIKDLKLEPLQIKDFDFQTLSPSDLSLILKQKTKKIDESACKKNRCICTDCNKDITSSGILYKDRAKHYAEHTNKTYMCPVCLFTVPSTCALKAHLRIHLKTPPYFCSECGVGLLRDLNYPYNHDCEGFRMIRATTRYKCFIKNCAFHPNKLIQHMKENHLTKVYKCTDCVIASYDETITRKHYIETHKRCQKPNSGIAILYQCKSCHSRLVDTGKKIIAHYESHMSNTGINKNDQNHLQIYPCWKCGTTFPEPLELLNHHNHKHSFPFRLKAINSSIKNNQLISKKTNAIYQVLKKCDKCSAQFTYRCKFDDINDLPNVCPHHCSPLSMNINQLSDNDCIKKTIICPLCSNKVCYQWVDIKTHFELLHNDHKCLDVEIKVKKLDLHKYLPENAFKKKSPKRKISNRHVLKIKSSDFAEYVIPSKKSKVINKCKVVCKICNVTLENKNSLENHLIIHRDPCMPYQCMECGCCFAGKPSFATHILLDHGISEVENYIETKQCYNKDALIVSNSNNYNDEPLKDNQCNICRVQYENSEDLEKHYRIHGMAFLMSNKIMKKTEENNKLM